MSKSIINVRMFATSAAIVIFAIAAAGGPALAQKPSPGVRRPAPTLHSASGNVNPLASGGGDGNGTTITNVTASPGVISFNAAAPGTIIPGSSPATVAFTLNSNTKGGTWTLSVGTTSTTFSGCTTVPTSAVSVWCSAATVSGSNSKGASAGCSTSAATPLPATLPGVQVAGGGEPQSQASNFNITLNYQLADSWKYIPNTCPLSITYTINAP